MKRLPGFVLLVLSWMQPLHLLPWVSWHSEVLAFAAVLWLFGVELLMRRTDCQKYIALPYVAVVPAVFAAFAAVQFASGQIQFFGDALVVCLYASLCAIATVVGFAWGVRKEPAEGSWSPLSQLAIAILVGAVASVFVAVVQSFQVIEYSGLIYLPQEYRRPGGNLAQPNQFATLVLLGFASLVYLLESKKIRNQLAATICFVLALGISISESRTGLLGFLALAVWWFYKRVPIGFKFHLPTVWLSGFAFAILVWVWPVFITFFHTGGSGDITLDVGTSRPSSLRLVIWPQLLEAAAAHSWFGWGIRRVSAAHNSVLHQYQHGEPYTYAHNLVLELVIWFGFPIALLLLGLLAYWVWHRVKKTQTLVQWYCIALAIPFAVHSMLEFPFAYAYLLVPIMFAVGALEANLAPERNIRLKRNVVAMSVTTVTAIMICTVVEYILIEEDFRVARFEALRIGKTSSQYQRPDIHLLTQLDAMLVATRAVPSPDMQKSEIELLRKSAMRFPWTAIQNRYALALALNGSPEEAIRQLLVIRAMFGEQTYHAIRADWQALAKEKHPKLLTLELP